MTQYSSIESTKTIIGSGEAGSNIGFTIIVDWSDESCELIRNVIEAKKRLEIEHLVSFDYNLIEKENSIYRQFHLFTPLVFYNGKLVSSGRVLSVDEIISIVMFDQATYDNGEKIVLDLYNDRLPPVFGAAELIT